MGAKEAIVFDVEKNARLDVLKCLLDVCQDARSDWEACS